MLKISLLIKNLLCLPLIKLKLPMYNPEKV